MDNIQNRIAYLAGLTDGLDFYDNRECKLINEIIDTIAELNDNLQNITYRINELEEYMDVIDEDLQDIELEYYDEDLEEELEVDKEEKNSFEESMD